MTSRRPSRRLLPRLALAVCLAATLSAGQEPVDRATIERISQEGTERSKAGAYFDHFVTVVGPRLTGSPAHKAAAEWAREQFAAAGLSNPHLEPFEFGRGWELSGFTLEMTSPRYMPLIGYPEGWSAPTAGVLEGTPLFLGDKSGSEVEQLKPRLKGAIVMSQPMQTAFVRADRAQPSTATEKVTIGAPPMPGTGRSQDDTRRITQALRIPTIGIGAGPYCDGQVQVFHDLLGMDPDFHPRHAKRYAELGETIRAAVSEYVADVGASRFPTDAQTISMSSEEEVRLHQLLGDAPPSAQFG